MNNSYNRQIETLESEIRGMKSRMDAHSRYIMDEVLPAIEKLQADMHRLWISDERFRELELALAEIAITVYNQRVKLDKRKKK